MSVFEDVIKKIEQEKIEAVQKVEEAKVKKTTETEVFQSEFLAATKEIAIPIFEQFKSDLEKYGYLVTIEEGKDGNENPYLSLRFLPTREGISTNSDYSAFILKGNIKKSKVEHNSYFDQRPGKNGIKKQEFGIQSIRVETLERNLSEFLTSALKSRENA